MDYKPWLPVHESGITFHQVYTTACTVIRNFQTTTVTEDFFVQLPQCIETLTVRIICAI